MTGHRFIGLLGVAEVDISGACPEDCLYRLTQRGIRFRYVGKPDALTATVRVARRDISEVQLCARRTMCTLERVRYGGAVPMLQGMEKRLLLIPLILGVFLFVFWLQSLSWFFEVSGNETIPAQQILQLLEENGVGFGSDISNMNMDELRNRLLERLPQLAWITINTDGPTASIIIHERTDQPVIAKDAAPTNILAEKSGRILSVEVVGGTPQVRENDVVAEGDLLISGISALDKTFLLTRAEGEVYAETWNKIRTVLPAEYTQKIYTGQKEVRYSLVVGKKTINFYKTSRISYGNYDKITESTELRLPGGIVLPLKLVKTTFRAYEPRRVTLDETAADTLLSVSAEEQNRLRMSAGILLDSDLTMTVQDGVYTMTGVMKCKEEIGVVSKIKD